MLSKNKHRDGFHRGVFSIHGRWLWKRHEGKRSGFLSQTNPGYPGWYTFLWNMRFSFLRWLLLETGVSESLPWFSVFAKYTLKLFIWFSYTIHIKLFIWFSYTIVTIHIKLFIRFSYTIHKCGYTRATSPTATRRPSGSTFLNGILGERIDHLSSPMLLTIKF